MTWYVVLATGESLLPDPKAIAARIRHLPTVAVSDAYELAPWAEALVACDTRWWEANPAALRFAGERWCANGCPTGVRKIPWRGAISTHTNSGLLGLDYWARRGKSPILLLGIDMRGTHYFGPHTKSPPGRDGKPGRPLGNTSPNRFAFFLEQFRSYAQEMPSEIRVVNCSLDSALNIWPKKPLEEVLQEEEEG